MNKNLLYLILFLCLAQTSHSQNNGVVAIDLPIRNSLKFNKYAVNPTFSFVREQNKYISFTNKRQWVQFEDAPQAYLFSYSGRFKENIGAGIGLFQQNYGVQTVFGGMLNFAYNAVLDRDSNLTFGLNIGAYQSSINEGNVVTNFQDPALQNIPKNTLLTVNPGINYGTAFFDFGFSVNNLVSYNLSSSKIIEDNPEQSYQAHIMYTGYMDSRGFFDESKFSTLIRSEFKKETTVLSGLAMLSIPKGIWGQVGYNTLYGASAGVGINITEQIAVEYNYEQSVGELSDFGNSHEFTIAYRFKNNNRYLYNGDDDEKSVFTPKSRKRTIANRSSSSKPKVNREEAARLKAEEIAQRKKALEEKRLARQEAERLRKEEQINNEEVTEDVVATSKNVEEEKIKAEAAAKLEAERKAKEEADRIKAEQEAQRLAAEAKAREEARLKAEAEAAAKLEAERKSKEEADRIKAEQEAQRLAAEAKAREEARLKAEAEAAAKLEAERKAKEEADRIKAEQEAQRLAAEAKAREEARLKAEAEAAAKLEAERKANEENLIEITSDLDQETINSINKLNESAKESKKQQSELIDRLTEKVAIKQKDLDDLKQENDLSEQGIYVEPKPFKSVTAENAEIEALKDQLEKVIEEQRIKIEELEAVYITRKRKVKDDNDALNIKYSKAIEKLKAQQLQAMKAKADLESSLETIKVATDYERKRRIKRAAYDNQQDRYKKDSASLASIKKFTQPSNLVLTEDDFDFGDEPSNNIQIVKNVTNAESGYYMVIAIHENEAKRNEFLTKVVSMGRKDIEFFFDVNTNKYFIYYSKFDNIEEAQRLLQSKGNEPYNAKMSIVKIEN
ncbi:PorP/SprF family type IX secretion system membrane protein [Seonamhaeicola sp. NFXS20]|uniref:PorP/SprF family type IX secretion system membrane protein n=1 Tax=Seonamhaeicola sp. NFXS20 TaxID=2816959 RepID=UPI003B8CC98A